MKTLDIVFNEYQIGIINHAPSDFLRHLKSSLGFQHLLINLLRIVIIKLKEIISRDLGCRCRVSSLLRGPIKLSFTTHDPSEVWPDFA
jgi:hypothetical protein